MTKSLLRCTAFFLIPALIADPVRALVPTPSKSLCIRSSFVEQAFAARSTQFLREAYDRAFAAGIQNNVHETWVSRLYLRLPQGGGHGRLLRVAVGGVVGGIKETLVNLGWPLLRESTKAILLSVRLTIAGNISAPRNLTGQLSLAYSTVVSDFRSDHRRRLFVGADIPPIRKVDMKTNQQKARWDELQRQADVFSQALAAPFSPFLPVMPSVFITTPLALTLAVALHLSWSGALCGVLAAMTPVIVPGLISAWMHIRRNSVAIWTNDVHTALGMGADENLANFLRMDQVPAPEYVPLYRLAPHAIKKWKKLISANFESAPGLPPLPAELVNKFNDAVARYQELQEYDQVAERLVPLTMPITFFYGKDFQPYRDAVEPGVSALINIRALTHGESPYSAVLLMRHGTDPSVGPYGWPHFWFDAQFLKGLSSILSPEEMRVVEADLTKVFGNWPGHSGYLGLLKELGEEDNDIQAYDKIEDYIVDRLIRGEMPPIWGVTLHSDMDDKLRRHPKGSAARLDQIYEQAIWRSVGLDDSGERSHIERLFSPSGDQIDFQNPLPEKMMEFAEHMDEDQTVMIVSMMKTCLGIHAALNPAFGLMDEGFEKQPRLRVMAEAFGQLLEIKNPLEAKAIRIASHMQALDGRITWAIRNNKRNELVAELNELLSDEDLDTDFISDQIGAVLAHIATREEDLVPDTYFVVDTLDQPLLTQTFMQMRESSAIRSDLRDLVKDIRAAAKGQLTPREVVQIEAMGLEARSIHEPQRRKGDNRPYFVHPLQVSRTLLDLFGITDPMAHQIALMHDTEEDQEDTYNFIMDLLMPLASTQKDLRRMTLLQLGVRMLTMQKTGQPNDEERYYRGLVHPSDIYQGFDFSLVTPEFIRHVQTIKLVDRIVNWKDFEYYFSSDPAVQAKLRDSEKLQGLAAKTFNKTFDAMIPGLVNNPDNQLTQPDVERFYNALMDTLDGYLAIDLDASPQAAPLKQAATDAVPRLKAAIRKNTKYFHQSKVLQDLADESAPLHAHDHLHLAHVVEVSQSSGKMFVRPEDVGTPDYFPDALSEQSLGMLNKALEIYGQWQVNHPNLNFPFVGERFGLGVGPNLTGAINMEDATSKAIDVPLLNLFVLSESRTPQTVVFLLRCSLERMTQGLNALDILQNAEFYDVLTKTLPESEAHLLRDDLARLYARAGDPGYAILLEKIIQTESTEEKTDLIEDYQTQRLVDGHLPSVLGITLREKRYHKAAELLRPDPNGPARLHQLCLDAVLARAEVFEDPLRATFRDIYQKLGNPEELDRAVYALMLQVHEDDQMGKVVLDVAKYSVELVAALNHNPNSTIVYEPEIAKLAEAMKSVMLAFDRFEGRDPDRSGYKQFVLALEMEKWKAWLWHAIRHGLQDQIRVADLRNDLIEFPPAQISIGNLLVEIGWADPALDPICWGIASAIGGQVLKEMETDVRRSELVQKKLLPFIQQVDEKRKMAKRPLLPGELSHLRFIGVQAADAHRNDVRLDGQPYFVHQIEVGAEMLNRFGIMDPINLQVNCMHDTPEDEPEAYESVTEQAAAIHGGMQMSRFNELLRLGAGMLTMIKTGDADYDERTYYAGLVDPMTVYPTLRTRFAYPGFIRGVQVNKLADRLHNWRTFNYFYLDDVEMTERRATHPQRMFEKTFNYMIPLFVNNPNTLLTPEDIVCFYEGLWEILQDHLARANTERARPLRQAALEAVPKFINAVESLLKEHDYFKQHPSPRLQSLLSSAS